VKGEVRKEEGGGKREGREDMKVGIKGSGGQKLEGATGGREGEKRDGTHFFAPCPFLEAVEHLLETFHQVSGWG
jgi:hypothetical protein